MVNIGVRFMIKMVMVMIRKELINTEIKIIGVHFMNKMVMIMINTEIKIIGVHFMIKMMIIIIGKVQIIRNKNNTSTHYG